MSELTILIVEDNTPDFEIVRRHLERKFPDGGIRLTRASTLEAARNSLQASRFRLVLLDLSLPDSTGLTTLKDVLPLTKSTPVVVMTNVKDERTGVEAVRLGAQDYLIKDETTSDLLSRSVAFAFERATRASVAEDRAFWQDKEHVIAGPFHIDFEKQKIAVIENESKCDLPFTTIEFKLFIFLIKNNGEVASRGQIVAEIWSAGQEHGVSARTIDKHISDMKRKFPALERYLESVYGVGYRMNLHAA